jgi:GNAT superfamily N-acetyltransferase
MVTLEVRYGSTGPRMGYRCSTKFANGIHYSGNPIMQLAFEEYRGRLVPPSGALTETLEEVCMAIRGGGAFLAFASEVAVGSARYRLFPDHAYAECVAVLPDHRGKGVAVALMGAFEEAIRTVGVREARVGVRASLPSNLRFYENLGYRALVSRSYPAGTDFEITLSKCLEAQPRGDVGLSAAQLWPAADAQGPRTAEAPGVSPPPRQHRGASRAHPHSPGA